MTIAQLRTLIPDKPQFDRASDVADGASVDFELPWAPVVADSLSVTVNGTPVAAADYTIDLDLGLVTFDTAPIADAVVAIRYQHVLLSDADLQTFLDLDTSVLLAAAQALDTIATNQALVLKVVRTLDISTDGAAVSRALRERAKALRDRDKEAREVEDAAFEIAEWVTTGWAATERLVNEALREG